MKHATLGLPFEIPYRNRQDYLYAPDVGAAIGHALLGQFQGYAAFTLPSHSVDTSAFVAAMRQAAAALDIEGNFDITIGSDEVPFICDVDYQAFVDAFPEAPRTSLDQAVLQSMKTFLDAVRGGDHLN